MTDKRPPTDDAQGDTTPLGDTIPIPPPAGQPKRPRVRSAELSAAQYLEEQNRIGQFNQYPLRKHRYVKLFMTNILEALVILYVHLFKLNWEKFSRAAEKFTLPAGVPDHYHYCAYVYLSHWMNDLYYSIRKSCAVVNPLAFVEKYHYEVGRYADRYDNFLSLLLSAIKPTPIVGAIGDEMYIPHFGRNIDFSSRNPLNWKNWIIDHTIFQLVHQTLELKKIVKFVPTSEDPTGRPSWLFDWFDGNKAYAWFPLEGNYNQIDIAVAFILGVACTPKISLPDIDEWRYFTHRTDPTKIDVSSYIRVTARRKYGTSEHRVLESEEVYLPNYYEKDKDKYSKFNIGPLMLRKLSSDSDAEAESSTTEVEQVPDSPRPFTRSQVATGEPDKAIRVRVLDYLYYTQVISRHENATRFAAFKLMMQPPL